MVKKIHTHIHTHKTLAGKSEKMPPRFIGCWFDDPKCDGGKLETEMHKLAISTVQNHNSNGLSETAPTTVIQTLLFAFRVS